MTELAAAATIAAFGVAVFRWGYNLGLSKGLNESSKRTKNS